VSTPWDPSGSRVRDALNAPPPARPQQERQSQPSARPPAQPAERSAGPAPATRREPRLTWGRVGMAILRYLVTPSVTQQVPPVTARPVVPRPVQPLPVPVGPWEEMQVHARDVRSGDMMQKNGAWVRVAYTSLNGSSTVSTLHSASSGWPHAELPPETWVHVHRYRR
jgi:hypothetical protein